MNQDANMKLKELEKNWDLIVIGGGITGAGILRESARMGLRVLLVEQKDFSWGTSSRSSKLVHGGLRYLKEGKIMLTWASVQERERLLREAPGLVEPLDFMVPVYSDQSPGKWMIEAGLSLYDLLARERQHAYYSAQEFCAMEPCVLPEKLLGGFRFLDAQVDDARLVQRVINEAVIDGAFAMNYTAVVEITRNARGWVNGVIVEDTETHEASELSTHAVINATGCWAEKLHPSPDPKRHIRPLRGSHLIFPFEVIPVERAVSLVHPKDNRPMFAIPWEGVVLVGTTDVDHAQDLSLEPRISKEEIAYLMEGIHAFLPSLDISLNDCISSIAGVRPVLSEGKIDPSKESREHVVWEDRGLVTVTGGKLTTFRRLAWDALKTAKPYLPLPELYGQSDLVFSPVPDEPCKDCGISDQVWRRLYGRYGESANELVSMAAPEDLESIPGTYTLWAELPFVARHEQVRHLSDLLLRRVRIGLLTPEGGKEYFDRIKKLCKPELRWDRKRWKTEIAIYLELWSRAHALPK
jgi:glycerol-3-phosphate dehydrogenase